jgi:uncharacterized RDD family membrane protein YckC
MKPLSHIYAGRLERLFANLIDSIFLVLIGSVVTLSLQEEGLIVLITFLISLGYYTHFTSSSWQATPGKRLLNIYVIRTDNRALTQRDAVERFLAYSIPGLPLYASFMGCKRGHDAHILAQPFLVFPHPHHA